MQTHKGAMTHGLNRWLLVLAVLFAASFWWLMIANNPGGARPKPIHIAELRQLAAAIPGPHPSEVRYTILATRVVPGDLFAAGIGLKRRPLAIISWYLPVAGAAPILIDADANNAEASARRFRNFDVLRQSRIDAETARAGLVIDTYQPMRSNSPLRPAPNRPLGEAGMAAETPSPTAPPAVRHDSGASAPMPLAVAAAPGVVVIPAPDYAPGAQLIFVQLADGREFLFAGDISALYDNWSQFRARSQLAAHWLAPQNRAATYPWLYTIRQLHAEAPKLTVVPGNDLLWLVKQRNQSKISEQTVDPPVLPPAGSTSGNAP